MKRLGYLLILSFVLTSGISSSAWAKKIKIFVFSDRGLNEEISKKQTKERNQVGKYLEKDLMERLEDERYKPYLIRSKDKWDGDTDTYLLYLTIIDYERKGAYPFFLETHFELYNDQNALLLTDNFEINSKKSWEKCAQKANKLLIQAIPRKKITELTPIKVKKQKKVKSFASKAILLADDEEKEKESPVTGNEEEPVKKSKKIKFEGQNLSKEEMLKQLNEQYENDQITSDEYLTKKEEILGVVGDS